MRIIILSSLLVLCPFLYATTSDNQVDFNGDGVISIHDLAHLVKQTIGFKGDLNFNIEKPDGTMRKLTDPSKLHGLGWKHKVELEEGIKKMYDWYIKQK